VRLGDEQQALNALDYRGLKIVVGMVKKSHIYDVLVSCQQSSKDLRTACQMLARGLNGKAIDRQADSRA
jgi:hypothetical protein